jgi:hypothetical protein
LNINPGFKTCLFNNDSTLRRYAALVGRNPTQIFLPWKGNILSSSVWFDNGLREGIVYPSTCETPPFFPT